MILLYRSLMLAFSLILFWMQKIDAGQQGLTKSNPSLYLSDETWEEVQDYLMPDDHPMKEKLDKIFSRSRVLENWQAMLAAGFETAQMQGVTQIVVARHPELSGYIIKAYLDKTKFGSKARREYEFLIARIIGARLTRDSIAAHNYEHLLKVPEKWLYLLPDEPPPREHPHRRKMFILVEDDMNIYVHKKNKEAWGSKWVTQELLEALYTVLTEVSLADSAKPSNCPFSRDGRVALIDTQMYHRGFVKYENLTPFLSPTMQAFWLALFTSSISFRSSARELVLCI